MKRPRRNHSPVFKAKVALQALRGDKTLAELAQQHDIHPNQITTWKSQLLEHAPSSSPTATRARQTPSAVSRSCTPRSGSSPWNVIFCPTRSGASPLRAPSDDQSAGRPAYRAPVRTARAVALIGLLRAPASERGGSCAHAPPRSAAPGASVPGGAQARYDAQARGLRRRSPARENAAAPHGAGGDLPQAPNEPPGPRAHALPVPALGRCHRAAEPSVGGRYHLSADGQGLSLPGGDLAPRQSQGARLAAVQYARHGLLCRGAPGGAPSVREPGDLQHRPRRAVYRSRVQRSASGP